MSSGTCNAAGPIWAAQLEELGVVSAYAGDPTQMHPPGYYLEINGWGGMAPGIDQLPAFIQRILAPVARTSTGS